MKHRPLITFYILSKLVQGYISMNSAPSFWTELFYTNENHLITLYSIENILSLLFAKTQQAFLTFVVVCPQLKNKTAHIFSEACNRRVTITETLTPTVNKFCSFVVFYLVKVCSVLLFLLP